MSEIKAPAGHKVFELSEPVGDSTVGVTTHVFLPLKLRAKHLRGATLSFNVQSGTLELSADAINAVLRNCVGLDVDVFGEICAVDLFMMGAAMMGEMGKLLPTSTNASPT